MNNLALLRLETDDSADVIRLLLLCALLQSLIGEGSGIGERLVELDHEIVLEILGYTATVLRRIADDLTLFRQHLHVRTLIQSVDHDVGMLVLGEGKTEHCRTLGRCQLRHDVMLGEIYLIIIGFRYLSLVREPACPLVLIELRRAHDRHDRKLSVVVDPGAWLVCLLKATDLVRRIDILPTVTHLTGLRCPEVHTPRTCDRRIGVTGG